MSSESLERSGFGGATGLAEMLCDENHTVRWAAAEVLAGIGPTAVPAVLTII